MGDLSVDCEQCGKRIGVFWQDSVCLFIDYLRHARPFADKVCVMLHTSRGYEAQFLLIRFFGIEMGTEIDNGRFQNS